MSLNGGGSGQLQLDTNSAHLVTRRHSSANNTLVSTSRLHYAADWIRATNDSVRAYRAASLAVPSSTSREERSLLDILMQQDEERKILPAPPPPPTTRRHSTANPIYSSNPSPNQVVPPPLPSRPPPPVPERNKPPPPPPPTRIPPPVTPRSRPGPPATPPRSPKPVTTVTTNFQALTDLQAQQNVQSPPMKNAQKENIFSNFTDISSELQTSLRRYSQGQTNEEAFKLPPPRPQAPFQMRKFSEGSNVNMPELTRNRSVKIPPPIQTQIPDEDVKPNLPPPQFDSNCGSCGKISMRQDSNVSSDSFSQNSSPSYTTKSMETPLLAGKTHRQARKKYINDRGIERRELADSDEAVSGSQAMLDDANNALTKSHSTPASLQTIVRFHHGSNMSIHHKIIRDIRRPSTHYITRNRLRFQFAQVIVNAIALLAIAGGLAAYFRAYPSAVRYVNKTVTTTTIAIIPPEEVNPAPGICLPVIVTFCQQHRIPYNFTMFPNYIGHFTQRDAQQELEVYDAVVDVRCYELAALFLCSVFVPKCGPAGQLVRPCRSLCFETKRRCGFFLEVFGLSLPDYLDCDLFPESKDTDVCVGHNDVIEAEVRAQKPVCLSGFQCDTRRCIPADWRCDGHVDCEDQSDELNCEQCDTGMIHCGENRCMAQSHMCDGVVDCPWGQDERNCLRLNERMGDEGRGKLEVFQPELQSWRPACVTHWDPATSPKEICSLLGYTIVNSSGLALKGSDVPFSITKYFPTSSVFRLYQKKKKSNLLRELRSCPNSETYPTVDLSCTNYACGVRRQPPERPATRIIGGTESTPGDWPFIAALLGGPEQVFYCAGVLIADQWVLTASHCVGNFSHAEPTGWTIQLGITRRHAHSYFGQKVKVKRVVPHPMYNLGVAHDNDVALFQLQSRVTFHEHLLPVCLPPENHDLVPGTMCTVIGWGKREDTDVSEYEAAVNEVQVPVLNRDLCNVWLEHRELNVTQGMICAGYPEGGKDACQGDSGGPLLCKSDGNSNQWFVGGIVSWGIKCAHPHLPGVYAYVPKYVPWIKQQMALYSSD